MRDRLCRIEPERLLVRAAGLGDVTSGDEHITKPDMRRRVVRPKGDGVPQQSRGLARAHALGVQDDCVQIRPAEVAFIERGGALVRHGSVIPKLVRIENHAKLAPCVGRIRILDDVLAAMPVDERVVFVMFELEELSTQEISSILEIPVGTVASRLRRAREDFERRAVRLNVRGVKR